MRLYIFFTVLLSCIILIQCTSTLLGTKALRQQVYHRDIKYSSKFLRKRVETMTFRLPSAYGYGKFIQGIFAYDLTNSGATANVTAGGLGYNFVTLRMKSDRGKEIHFDVNIYA